MNTEYKPDPSWDNDYSKIWVQLQISHDEIRKLRKALYMACEFDKNKVYRMLEKAELE